MNIWDDLKSVLFVAPEDWVTNPLEFKMLLDHSFIDVQQREIILISPRKNKANIADDVKWITYFSHNDFNLLGRSKNEKVKEILLKKFDTLIICGTLNKRMTRTLLNSHYQRVIGLNSENDFIEINLHSKSNEPSEMVNFAKNTLSKIIS